MRKTRPWPLFDFTADTALRLTKAFGTSEGFWLGLQADYDLEESRKQIGADLDQIERLAA